MIAGLKGAKEPGGEGPRRESDPVDGELRKKLSALSRTNVFVHQPRIKRMA